MAGATLTVLVVAVVKGGWLALAPFILAALIVAALLWLMRATERSAKWARAFGVRRNAPPGARDEVSYGI